jgi:hypothetical protein
MVKCEQDCFSAPAEDSILEVQFLFAGSSSMPFWLSLALVIGTLGGALEALRL